MSAPGDYGTGDWLLLDRTASLLARAPRWASRARITRTTGDVDEAARFDAATALSFPAPTLLAVPLLDPRETVRVVDGDLHCACGNTPDEYGFTPCTDAGARVEPTAADWPRPLYLCDYCGRILEYPVRPGSLVATVTGYADPDA